MKKFILLGTFCLVLIGFVSISFAAPFLSWTDPNLSSMNIDKSQVELNGTIVMDVLITDGLKYDLAGLADGSYTARVRFHNVWGWSNFSVPFDFDKQVPGAPTGVGLSTN